MKAPPLPHPAAAPGAWLQRMLQTVCRCAAGDLRRMAEASELSIHALRVRMKKLRALLRLAEPVLPEADRTRLRRRIRDIKNAFSSSRETAVLEKLAAGLRRRHGLPAAELTAAPAHRQSSLSQVRSKLETLRRSLTVLPLHKLTLTGFLIEYAARYRACRRAMRRCLETGAQEAFHRWRQRTKEWYFLSLALHAFPSARAGIRPSAWLAHRLGEENDLALLGRRITGPHAEQWRRVIEEKVARQQERILRKGRKKLSQPRRRLLGKLKSEAARIESSGRPVIG